MNFKEFWKSQKDQDEPNEEMLDGVKNMVLNMDEQAMADEEISEEDNEKSSVEKPGNSIHSQKWDDCVANASKNPDVNAYAICTSQLGEESFKSLESMTKAELKQAAQEVKEAMGIDYAGDVPNSLLAGQDLEDEEKERNSSAEITSKDALTRTANELDEIVDEAKEKDASDNTQFRNDLVENIQNIQQKRQKAAIIARKGIRNFNDKWRKLHE